MPLRDILKKKDKIKESSQQDSTAAQDPSSSPPTTSDTQSLPPPDFKIVRTTTDTQEILFGPSIRIDSPQTSRPSSPTSSSPPAEKTSTSPSKKFSNRLSSSFHIRNRSSRSGSLKSDKSSDVDSAGETEDMRQPREKRLSSRFDRLHMRSRSREQAGNESEHVPENLPHIELTSAQGEEVEAEWEKRALLLAQKNRSTTELNDDVGVEGGNRGAQAQNTDGTASDTNQGQTPVKGHSRSISNADGDINIQEAIRLHELGDPSSLTKSTQMFAHLADPSGTNNALAQVLYGLSLRHGWGCDPSPTQAIKYLSLAASNSASIESMAISSGLNKGGAAKGELVLAIFELGNCFRYGWGCKQDPVAARRYYETAANLGDTDALGEIAWAYLEGFGGKKDKYKAARYLRIAEKKGVSGVGNSWIWKEKYNEIAEGDSNKDVRKA